MKILIINVVCGVGSTGRICAEAAEKMEAEGHEVRIAYGRGEVPDQYRKFAVRIGNDLDILGHVMKARVFDAAGFGSKRATKRFLKWADDYKPDLLWLHNLHGYYINVAGLFNWIKKRPQMQVKWTLHDCWAFTGHCTHYMVPQCTRWQYDNTKEKSSTHRKHNYCGNCPERERYPKSLFLDRSQQNFERKSKCFTGVLNLELKTPSKWLAGEVGKSYLKDYPISVEYNSIDTDVFCPTESNIRERYGIGDKIMLLGVASKWTDRKGLKDFIKLQHMLNERYCIFLIGLTRRQIKCLQSKQKDGCARFRGIERTNSKSELAEAYTAADWFLNLTYEDNFPTVNMEAEACGTDVITYDVGGCRETIRRTGSFAIRREDIVSVKKVVAQKNSIK